MNDLIEIESIEPAGVDATFPLGEREVQTFTRPPQLLTGYYLGAKEPFALTVMNLHLRSLLNIDDPAQGNFVRQKRLAQARFVAETAQLIQQETPGVNLILAGDFNAFEFSDGYIDTLGIITGLEEEGSALLAGETLVDPPLSNQVLSLDPLERYSNSYLGNATPSTTS